MKSKQLIVKQNLIDLLNRVKESQPTISINALILAIESGICDLSPNSVGATSVEKLNLTNLGCE